MQDLRASGLQEDAITRDTFVAACEKMSMPASLDRFLEFFGVV